MKVGRDLSLKQSAKVFCVITSLYRRLYSAVPSLKPVEVVEASEIRLGLIHMEVTGYVQLELNPKANPEFS